MFRLLFRHERSDGFVWRCESRIVSIDDAHRNDRYRPAPDIPLLKRVQQRKLDVKANGSLRSGDARIERQRRDFARRKLGAPQDEADLRPVPVGDDEPEVGFFKQWRNLIARRHACLILIGDPFVIFVFDQRIPADRHDNCANHFRSVLPQP